MIRRIERRNVDPNDEREGIHLAAQATEAPLNDFMLRLMAQELPLLDSVDRGRVYELLREYQEAGGETITSQEQLPTEIRDLMDLY